LYQFVGKPWGWIDKLAWSDDRWRDYVGSDNLRTWVAWHGGAIAWYYELLRQNDDVEIIFKVPIRKLPMQSIQTEMVFLDTATYCIAGFFGCLAFMIIYLRRNMDDELKEKVRNAIWLENIFYFRDFTKKRFGRVHYVYYLAMLFVGAVLAIFCINIYLQFQTIEPFYRYLLLITVGIVVGLAVGLVYRLSGKRYYG